MTAASPVLGVLLPGASPPDGYGSLLVWIRLPARYAGVRLLLSVDGVNVPVQQGQWRVPVLPGRRAVTFTVVPNWIERHSLSTAVTVTSDDSYILVFEVDFRSYRILEASGAQVAHRRSPEWVALLIIGPVALTLGILCYVLVALSDLTT